MNEAVTRIKKAGSSKVRAVPISGGNIDGDYQIEVMEDAGWVAVVSGLKKAMAEDLISQSLNRVLLG